MRIALISDIHGNFEAFGEVLADIEQVGADVVVSLGDIVGYGPDPEKTANLVRTRGIPSVMGNHELALARPDYLRWFNQSARESLLLTRELLEPETREWLSGLPPFLAVQDALVVHGCPPDSMTDYLFGIGDDLLAHIFTNLKQRICFVGHTHTLELVSFADGRVRRCGLGRQTVLLEESARHIVNVGSVGQPRDGDNRAKYVIWDDSLNTVEVHYVSYDIGTTVEKILRLGFPQINAKRLW